ncbi:hypothetical protein Tco_0070655 [Tanacetum coccineum]
MSMTIQSSVKDKILATLSETSKVENTLVEMLRDLDQQMEKRADDGCTLWIKLYSKYGYEIYNHPGKENVVKAEHQRPSGLLQQPEIPEWKEDYSTEKLAKIYIDEIGRETWSSCVDYSDKMDAFTSPKSVLLLSFEYKMAPLKPVRKEVVVRPFLMAKIGERIGPVAYRLRLPEELSGVHETFHVSNLKKYLADASLHVPLDEIKVDKTLRFVEEPVEIMDREVKRLKRSMISIVKVRWNSKRGPKFTWEHEDYMKSKYPQLFVEQAGKLAS